MKRILISVPGQYYKNIYLPYVWAVLKTHAEHDPEIRAAYEWLEPVYLYHGEAFDQLDQISDLSVDVLGLSCYVWNWSTNLEIARRVKTRNPDCLVVAGGPHPAWGEPGFIDAQGVIDIIVKREGEEPFRRILKAALAAVPDFTGIPNLILRGDRHTEDTGPLDLTGMASPILAQAASLARMSRDLRARGRDAHMMWETNRGCPYSCAFCDWGSATNAKVRRFDMTRLEAEIDWFSEARLHTVFIADANYGMLKRDEETAERLCLSKRTTGYPEYIVLNPPKNRQDVMARITERFCEAGLFALSSVNFQHTRAEVLQAIARENIPIRKLMEPIVRQWTPQTPITAVLITGNPGDTHDLWMDCHDDILEWGFHEDIVAVDFVVLPNAPAGSRAYRAQWQIETIRRRIPLKILPKSGAGDRAENFCEYIVATSSFDRDDWVRMRLWTTIVQGFHNYGATRFISAYLRHYHGCRYRDVYEALVDRAPQGGVIRRLTDRLKAVIGAYLSDPEGELFVDCHADLDFLCPVEGAAFFLAVLDVDGFYADIEEILIDVFHVDPAVAVDLIAFQRGVLITPDYDPAIGRDVALVHNWPEVFRAILTCRPTELPELVGVRVAPSILRIRDTVSGHLGRTPLGFENLADYYLKIVRVGYMRNFTGYFRAAILSDGMDGDVSAAAPRAATTTGMISSSTAAATSAR